MSRKRKTKLPKNNGRPQLWMRKTKGSGIDSRERLRIIYPNGAAEFSAGHSYCPWCTPCWSVNSRSISKQVQSMLEYDASQGFTTLFLGYL